MAFETPLYMQNAPAPQYPARLDRRFIEFVFRNTERVLSGLVVSQKAGVQDNSVDITAGASLVMGDNISRQGLYLVMSNDAEFTAGKVNLVLPAKPSTGLQRYDRVFVRVRDSQAIGSGTDIDAIVDYASGSTASSNPPLPTVPASCLLLARVLRTATESAILNAAITDEGVRAAYPYGSGDNPPTGIGAPGDLYIEW